MIIDMIASPSVEQFRRLAQSPARSPNWLRQQSHSQGRWRCTRSGPAIHRVHGVHSDTTPIFDADGLMSALPSVTDSWLVDWDDPFYENYQWIAMLNPIELTRSAHDRSSTATVTDVCEVRVVEHDGRRAWEAIVRTTEEYDARCECCPLLSGYYNVEAGRWVPGPPVAVRLDVQTGICVYVGPTPEGPTEGFDIDVTILAVDEPLHDNMFVRGDR